MRLEVKNLFFRYPGNKEWLLNGLNLTVEKGEKVALVGSSGCGKSTLAKIIAGYLKQDKGEILLNETTIQKSRFCPVQMIYQHPELSVNPRHKMGKILNECYNPEKELLDAMGIEKEWLSRWPNELSGGELQRFCIARVLSRNTKFLICDEISTMLDVITQAQIWEALVKIASEREMGLLIVTHNEALAKRVSDRVAVFSELAGML